MPCPLARVVSRRVDPITGGFGQTVQFREHAVKKTLEHADCRCLAAGSPVWATHSNATMSFSPVSVITPAGSQRTTEAPPSIPLHQ